MRNAGFRVQRTESSLFLIFLFCVFCWKLNIVALFKEVSVYEENVKLNNWPLPCNAEDVLLVVTKLSIFHLDIR
jgi:hypothetical protein